MDWNDEGYLYSEYVRAYSSSFKELQTRRKESNAYSAQKYWKTLGPAVVAAMTARAVSRRHDIKKTILPLYCFEKLVDIRHKREKADEAEMALKAADWEEGEPWVTEMAEQ